MYLYYHIDTNSHSIIFEKPVQYETESETQCLEIPFNNIKEAQQCIEFLDEKTKCEAFKLAN